jgi:type VI secretion system protein ImpE
MTGKAEQLLRDGELDGAIAALSAALRDQPDDTRARIFLFELLCFAGDHDRAEKHLQVLAQAGKDAAVGALLYHGALHAERTRRQMFETGEYPAASAGASAAGVLNGRPFTSLADADSRIGPRLEVFAAGAYFWAPFAHISTIEMNPPKRLRDLLWAPARIKTGPAFGGAELGEVLLPALSPLSFASQDNAIRLGRVTEWFADDNGREFPLGAKTLLVDGEEIPLLELRSLRIASADATSVSA